MTVADVAAFVTALEDASGQSTGCLYVADAHATRSGRVFFRDSKIYAVHVDGFMPKVGQRLRTGGMLTADQYETLLTKVNGNIHAPSLGIAAVEHGFIEQEVLDAVLREILLSSIGAMFGWNSPTAKFKRNSSTDQFTIPPVSVAAIIKAVTKRHDRWTQLWNEIAPGQAPETTYPTTSSTAHRDGEPSEVAAVLAAANGALSLDGVAGECGLTRFETGHVLGHLVASGHVVMNTSPDHTGDQASVEAVHGTAEAATSNDVTHTDISAPANPNEEDVVLPPAVEQSGYTDETVDHETVNAEAPAPHFAPDVIDTVAHVDVEGGTEDEPSAFGAVEETLPDGMDLGTIPTEQIEYDPTDEPPTSNVPPLQGMVQVLEDHDQSPGSFATAELDAPVSLPPHVTTPYSEVGFTTGPPAIPEDFPHFAEPVAPVDVPVEDQKSHPDVSQGDVSLNKVQLPVDVPVFVDGSVLDRSGTLPALDMPEVPLPPLPGFFAPPVVLPVGAPEVVNEEPFTDKTEQETDESTSSLDEIPVEEHYVVGDHEEVSIYTEAVTEPVAPTTLDPRAEIARTRLLDEINAAAEAATAAENALARAESDHDSHVAATDQIGETRRRYEEFLHSAETEEARLKEEADELADAKARAATEKDLAEEARSLAAASALVVSEKVEQAAQALREAEAAFLIAEEDLVQVADEESRTAHYLTEVARRLEELTAREADVAADLEESSERARSYATEIAEVSEMEDSILAATATAEALKAAAEHRLESTRANLTDKQDRLAQLG